MPTKLYSVTCQDIQTSVTHKNVKSYDRISVFNNTAVCPEKKNSDTEAKSPYLHCGSVMTPRGLVTDNVSDEHNTPSTLKVLLNTDKLHQTTRSQNLDDHDVSVQSRKILNLIWPTYGLPQCFHDMTVRQPGVSAH